MNRYQHTNQNIWWNGPVHWLYTSRQSRSILVLWTDFPQIWLPRPTPRFSSMYHATSEFSNPLSDLRNYIVMKYCTPSVLKMDKLQCKEIHTHFVLPTNNQFVYQNSCKCNDVLKYQTNTNLPHSWRQTPAIDSIHEQLHNSSCTIVVRNAKKNHCSAETIHPPCMTNRQLKMYNTATNITVCLQIQTVRKREA